MPRLLGKEFHPFSGVYVEPSIEHPRIVDCAENGAIYLESSRGVGRKCWQIKALSRRDCDTTPHVI